MKTRLKPFFSYYGSKWRLSPFYPQPFYNKIIEPFAGSACYSLFHHDKEIILYDAYDKIVQLWSYLINVSEKEISKLPLLNLGQEIPYTLIEEQKILIGFWTTKASTYPGKTQSSYVTKDNRCLGQLGFWSESIRSRIAKQLKFIRHWKIEQKDYKNINGNCCTWFIDPPYQIGGNRYKHNKIDYQHLKDWSLNREGQIIVCENNNADWLNFVPFNQTKGIKRNTLELIYHSNNTN